MNYLGQIKFKAKYKDEGLIECQAYISSEGILFSRKKYNTILTRPFLDMLRAEGWTIEPDSIAEKSYLK